MRSESLRWSERIAESESVVQHGKADAESRELCSIMVRLEKRRMKTEAHVGHTLLRLEVDVLASDLRKANERVRSARKLNLESVLNKLKALEDTRSSQQSRQAKASETCMEATHFEKGSKSQMRTREAEKRERLFKKTARQLERTSAELRSAFDVSSGMRLVKVAKSSVAIDPGPSISIEINQISADCCAIRTDS